MLSTAHASFAGHVRSAFTLAESLAVLSIAGILLALVVSRFSSRADRLAVRSAIGDAEAVFAAGRELALSHRAEVAVLVDTLYGDMRVMEHGTRLAARRLRAVYGVRLTATRDSMVYDARGLGRGVANLRVVALRGSASDTLFVSRLGRVRRAGQVP
jgi:prepilin-type N-terminal cleavage/methylation domain-containing protein